MDISPEILDSVKKYFFDAMESDPEIKRFMNLISGKRFTYTEAQKYSKRIGEILGKSFAINLKSEFLPNETLYWNIAKSVVEPMIVENHRMVMTAGNIAAINENSEAGIVIGSVTPELNNERVKGMLDSLCEEDINGIQLSQRLQSYTTNITESFFDDFIRENADFQYMSGMEPQVIRIGGAGCCKWCKNLNGVYNYADVKNTGNNVWRRHQNCHCQVIFKNNRRQYMQGAHTKRALDKVRISKDLLTLDEGTYTGKESGSTRAKNRGSKYSIKNMPIKDRLSSDEESALVEFLRSKGVTRVGQLTPKEYIDWLYNYRKKKG